MNRREPTSPARVPLVIAIVVVAALLGYLVTRALRGSDDALPLPTVAVPSALAGATSAPPVPATPSTPVPTASGVRRALAGVVTAPGLGGRLLGRVLDAGTGRVLFDAAGATPAAPASTAKLMTAAALLDVHKPTDRFATTVVAGANTGTVYLVGGGDPTITGAPDGSPGAYGFAARISTLAAQLHAAHVRVTRIVDDATLFTGPGVSPNWAAGDVPSDYGAPITALMVDGGRYNATDYVRNGDPVNAAGQALARALHAPSLPVTTGRAPAGAKQLARVYSAPISVLIDQMLHQSDNVIAEVLARQVALATHRPASFTGATAAIRGVLARLGVPIGSGMHDASGLANADRVSPATLAAVLRLIADGPAPALRTIVGELPVAGWNGTLFNRFVSGSEASVAGRVRAKTGTLTGVSALAGYVHDRSGRLLVFAFDADRAGDTLTTEAAIDRVVTALAGCGCQ